MYKVTVGDRFVKVLKNMLLVPVWLAAHIVSWLVLIAGVLSARILRIVCYIAIVLDIVMVCMTGAVGIFLAFLAVIGIVWALPYFMDYIIEKCGDLADIISCYWNTPIEPKFHAINSNTQSDDTAHTQKTGKAKTNAYYSNAKQASTEKPPAYTKSRVTQTPHGTRVTPVIETPEVIALPPPKAG